MMQRAYGLAIPTRLEDVCEPSKLAILIYDMQVGIVPQIADGPRILAGCRQLLEHARKKGYRVFYTRHITLPNEASGAMQLRRAMIWQRKEDAAETTPVFLPGSRASQVVEELSPAASDVVLEKITMSAFEGTYLNIALRDLNLQAFLVAGIALEVGIVPTVRQALDLNYLPVVLSNMCGSRTEELHRESIASLQETGEVIVCSLDDFISASEARLQ